MLTPKLYEKKFVLLGSRNYVHGTSMTNGLLEAIEKWEMEPIDQIQFNIHKPLTEHGRYELFTESCKPTNGKMKYTAIFRLFATNVIYWVGLKETGIHISIRQPYSEEDLIEGYNLIKSNKSIMLDIIPHSPSINIVIALNKKLADWLFPSDGYGQWYLSKYDLSWSTICLTKPKKLAIKHIGKIGMSHIHSTVTLDSENSGSIYFSRHKK
jgi:hypothetical protein